MPDKLSDTQLEAILAQQIELAKSHYKAERQQSHDKELNYYFGKMDSYVPPEANRSKVVSRDVADTIGWLMPQLMRVFTASGRMFVAEPVEPEDLDYAEGATDGLNYVFWKDNKGYEVVYSATWDSLLHGDGIVKTYWDETPVYGPAKYHEALSEDELALLMQDDAAEVLAQTKTMTQGMDPMTGQPMDMPSYDVKVRRKKYDGRLCVEVIPPEDFLIDADAICLDDAAFKSHWGRKTRSDLVAMGYPKDDVWSIPEAARNETAEAQARRNAIVSDSTDKSMELVDYFECFVMVDADGDGEAELIRACYAGGQNGKLLDWEVWEDEDPFDNIPCEPIPHRWDSRSVADEEIDVQDVKTVLTRQMLNNTYWVNNPQRFVQGKVKNPDALDNPVFGQTVFGETGTVITDLPVPYIGDKALLGINYMDEVSARRTGVNSQSMALDPEVLQNQSATANQNATDASRSQPELIARNMAEYGWSKVGRKMLRILNRHQTQPRTILVKGKPVQINPADWNPDMHVNVNTGLGTGSRDKDAMMLGQVLQQQILYTDRIAQAFPEKALDMLPFIHNTLTRFAESTGLKNPELYWPEIDPNEIVQGKQILAQRGQQQNPEIVKAQLDAQNKDQQAQRDTQAKDAQAQRDHEYRMQQQKDKQDLAALAANNKLLLDKYQTDNELALKQWQISQEMQMNERLGLHKQAVNAEVKVGGQPG